MLSSPPGARRGGQDDVDGEQRRVGEGELHAQGLAVELNAGEQVDAGHEDQRRGRSRLRTQGGQHDHRQELDRRHGAERQPVDGEVEAAVHHREHGSPGEQQPPPGAIGRSHGAPGRRQSENTSAAAAIRSHATPNADTREQQHRERGAQVVEDRADDEVQVGWDALAAHTLQPAAAGPSAPGQSNARLPSMPSNRSQNGTDAVGMRLLGELQADARLSNAELGRRVGLSAPAVAERLGLPGGERRDPRLQAELTPPRSATRSAWSCGSGSLRAS